MIIAVGRRGHPKMTAAVFRAAAAAAVDAGSPTATATAAVASPAAAGMLQ